MKQIGRNQPCWCGSQKKYKHCHLTSDQADFVAKPIIPRSEKFINGMVQANILATKTIQMLENFIEPDMSTNRLTKTIQMLENFIEPDMSTNRLNDLAHRFIVEHNGMPASLNYYGFPKSICNKLFLSRHSQR